jgi:hypothetical protein
MSYADRASAGGRVSDAPTNSKMKGPVGVMVKGALRAARWASGRPDREEKLRGIIMRTSQELEELMKG